MATPFPIATLTLPPLPATQPGTSATVTFYSVSGDNNFLRFVGPQTADTTNVLTAGIWNPAYATYSWNQAESKISWGITTPSANPAAGTYTANGVATITPQKAPNPSISADSRPPNSIPAITSKPTSSPLPTGASSTPAPNEHGSDGLSNGAVAGIAIGCLIAGALIAGLLSWLFLRKKKPTSGRDSETSALALMHREKAPTTKAISLESGSPVALAMENGLPQPLEDKAISGEISKISNLIKNHVQSYYHTARVSAGMIDYDDIQALGNDLPVSTGTLSTLLGNSATREIALRLCIAWVVISRMQLHSPPGMTFLPPEIARCLQSMSLVDRGSRVHASFFAKWRAITAELMQSTYVRNPFTANDARLQNIQQAASVLDNILRAYSDSRMDEGQRNRNLEEILKRAALFAFTLFSQPSSWDFDWQGHQGVRSGSLCIFPALVQVADENGEPVKPPRPFNEAVVRRLDE